MHEKKNRSKDRRKSGKENMRRYVGVKSAINGRLANSYQTHLILQNIMSDINSAKSDMLKPNISTFRVVSAMVIFA